MAYLQDYADLIAHRGNPGLASSLRSEAEEFGDKYLQTFSWQGHVVGLLFGNVQSGKTTHMFAIIAKAADLGFPAFVILTTNINELYAQTLSRVRSDLSGFCICGENDTIAFSRCRLERPTIIVIKKNAKVLRQWNNELRNCEFMRGNALMIIDDEADSTSLNTKVNQGDVSAINERLDTMKQCALCSIYLQVTGTPQALFLQTMASGWKPSFTHYFPPGIGYMGGDFFFGEGSYPARITFTDDIRSPVREVLIRHLGVSAVALASGAKACNCLMHISARQKDHGNTVTEVNKWLDHWSAHKDELISEIDRIYRDIDLSEHMLDSSPAPQAHAMILENKVGVMMVNAKGNIGQAAGRLAEACTQGCNIIVGGNVLSRGLTIPCLQTTYYARHSKYPQADTIWQHSRMFGYDRDPHLVKVFIPRQLYKIFADLNNTNKSMVSQAQAGAGKIKFFYAGKIKPTRSNVLDRCAQAAVAGGTNYFASRPGNRTYEDLCQLLEPFSEDEPMHQVALTFIIRLLSHIIASEDFRLSSHMAFLEAITADRPAAQGWLIVRRGRDITQGTGALLSESDWKLGAEITNEVVLTMYQVMGDKVKGWDGSPLWVPNIKFPENMTFFDVIEPKRLADAEGGC